MDNNTILGGLALMFLLPFGSHSEEVTSTSSELSVDDDTVKLALKVNKKLIEEDLKVTRHVDRLDLHSVNEIEPIMQYYFQEYLPVTKDDGEPINLAIKSANVEGDSVVFNLEAPLENAHALSINNRLLFDANEDQVNKVVVEDHSYTFTSAVDEPLIVWQKEDDETNMFTAQAVKGQLI
ncbi:DUF6702 family protein [Gayadomonas joobiniege]|uniref:DUF6702 family protein n=1 Tax=Gayadomonas joobiniege TaxID=1234606 RepID=UPI0003611F67|nr:DUF6702 family protein [Gayadomonas joobiniege]